MVEGAAAAAPRTGAGDENTSPYQGRPRYAAEELLREAIIGYVEDGSGDPPQSGVTAPRQSREITELASGNEEIPVAKDRRAGFVWVAGAKGSRKKYTWNADEMAPLPQFKQASDNTCDICGRCCSEVLYEFRCYRRLRRGQDSIGGERRLHPFVSYISKECGRGLLGAQSELSKIREQLYRLVSDQGEGAVETLRALWEVATKVMKKVIKEELRHLARASAGNPIKAAELRAAEAAHGPIHRAHEDPFRAIGRAVGPALTGRELAAAAIRSAIDSGRWKPNRGGFYEKLATCVRDRQPLPSAPTPMPRASVVEGLRLLVRAWPIQVKLLDTLVGEEVFAPKDEKPLLSFKLVYLPGAGELHAPLAQKVDASEATALRESRAALLRRCREIVAVARAAAPGGVQRAPAKAQDKAIELPANHITTEYVRSTLEGITWPCCFSRGNVKPDDVPFILAFPLGLVNNYCFGLCCSRTIKLWPNLTTLLTNFISQEQPSFRYTTIQLNRDYAAKLHVDGNNHGPSYIIAFGEYSGGELWIMNEGGDVELEVTDPLRGWPHIKVGSMLRGNLVDIRNRWVKFDGNTPHQAMPFKGQRISIVYFSRKGFIKIPPEAQMALEAVGFRLPGEAELAQCTVRTEEAGPRDGVASLAAEAAKAEESEEDEVDEDEQVDAAMREDMDSASWLARGWAGTFRDRVGVPAGAWGAGAVDQAKPIGLFTANLPLGSPILALQDLLEGAAVRVLAMSEVEATASKFVRRNLHPEHFSSATFGTDRGARGAAHCEVHHKSCEAPAAELEDILVASFSTGPFLNRDPSRSRHSCFDDPRALAFWRLRRHIEVRRPRIAVLEAPDFEDAPVASRAGVLAFLLNGTDPRAGTNWGLKSVKGYGLAAADLWLPDYGLPRAEARVHFILVREDCGGQRAADAVAGLARCLARRLPTCTAQELLFEDDDPRLLELQRSGTGQASDAAVTTSAEAKAKGVAALDEEVLRRFPRPAPVHLERLGVAASFARETGLDMDSLMVDLAQDARLQPWRDDGLLPPLPPGAGGPRYSFSRKRPLTGQEELLCHGLPVWRLAFQGLGDEGCSRLAAGAMPVPVIGATLCAALAVVDFGEGRRLKADADLVAELLAELPQATGAAALAQAQLDAAAASEAAAASGTATAGPGGVGPVDVEEAQFEGRAAALLSIISHGSFGRDAGDAGAPVKKPSEAAQLLIASLGRLASGGGADAGPDGPDAVPGGATAEPQDWPTRLRKLRTGIDRFSFDTVARWTKEASDDPDAPLAQDLVTAGISRLKQQLSQDPTPDILRQAVAADIQGSLRAAGREEEAKDFDGLLRTARFLQTLASGDARFKLGAQTPETMPRYINTVVLGCDRNSWPMRRGLLEHLSKEAAPAAKVGTGAAATAAGAAVAAVMAEFARQGGWDPVARWLAEAPADVKAGWPSGGVALQTLAAVVPPSCSSLLVAMHDLDQRPGEWSGGASKAAQRIESAMVEAVAPALAPVALFPIGGAAAAAEEAARIAAEEAEECLKEFAASTGSAGKRFQRTVSVLEFVRQAGATLQKEDAHERTAADWQEALNALQEGLGKGDAPAAPADAAGSAWVKLASLEDALGAAARTRLEERLAMARRRDEKQASEARDAEEREKGRKAEEVARALLEHIKDGQLRCTDEEGFREFLVALQATTAAQASCRLPPEIVHQAVYAGKAAARRYSDAPIRSRRAREWLAGHGLRHCALLLEVQGLLDRLPDVAKSAELQQRCSLPTTCRAVLAKAAEEGHLRESHIAPPGGSEAAPPGWARRLSRTAGVSYFQALDPAAAAAAGIAQTQWRWPLPPGEDVGEDDAMAAAIDEQEEALASEELPPPEAGVAGSAAAGMAGIPGVQEWAAYLEPTSFGDVFCIMCARTGRKHLRTASHQQAVSLWNQLTETLAGIRADLQPEAEAAVREGVEAAVVSPCIGLSRAWRGELRRILCARKEPRPIKGTFWHRAVLPNLPVEGVPGCPEWMAFSALTFMVKAASISDPPPPPDEPSAPSEPVDPEADAQILALDMAVRRVRSRLTPDGSLKQDSVDGLNQLLGILQELRARLLECPPPLGAGRDALATGENAVRQFCERPARRMEAREWLARLGLSHCVAMLESEGLLDRLPDLPTQPSWVQRAGLPRRCRDVLLEALSRTELTDAHLAPALVPLGWRRAFSRNVGLEYFVEEADARRSQWEWPVPQPPEGWGEPREPPAPPRPQVGAPLDGAAPYLELDLSCEPHCLLCGKAGRDHLTERGHAAARALWLERVGLLEALLPELAEAANRESQPARGLATAWRGELLFTVCGGRLAPGSGAPLPDGIAQALWHLVVRPHLANTEWTLSGCGAAWLQQLLTGLGAASASARAPELGLALGDAPHIASRQAR